MIKEKYLVRGWAETIRLYSGLLSEQKRVAFIKEIADKDILLAAECRTSVFAEDIELDQYLVDIAVESTKEISKAAQSAKGLLALAEIDRFDEISSFFRSTKYNRNPILHFKVISIFLRNGNDRQIFELQKILATSHALLFSKTLDFILDSAIEGVFDPARGTILLNLVNNHNDALADKIICLYGLKNQITDSKLLFYRLLRSNEIKYAERLAQLAKIDLDNEIENIFTHYIQKGTFVSIQLLLNIVFSIDPLFSRSKINLRISQSLNPKIKSLSLLEFDGSSISQEDALEIYKANINIGNRSSVEFALNIIDAFELNGFIKVEDMIKSLLREAKFQRIQLAMKIAEKFGLKTKYTDKYFFYLLIGNLQHDNLALARKIAIECLDDFEKNQALRYLLCLSLTDTKFNKLTKQILLEDLRENFIYNYENEYVGLVVGRYKKKVQILFSIDYPPITISSHYKLSISNVVTFKFTRIHERLEQSEINIIRNIEPASFNHKYCFEGYYIGESISFKPTSIYPKKAIMKIQQRNISMIVPIGNIANVFIKDINDYVQLNYSVNVKIASFNRKERVINCSIKDFDLPFFQLNTEQENISDKLNQLVKKYKK